MAPLGDEEARYETSSYSHLREVPKLLRDYGIVNHSFRSLSDFKRICKNYFEDLMKGDMEGKLPYLEFTLVRMSDLSCIDEIRGVGNFPKMTLLYDSGEKVLIVKFMVGVKHETWKGLLHDHFFIAVYSRVGHAYSLRPLGSARFRNSSRMKEADDAFAPTATRDNEDHWPTVVFEVGVSETLTQLRLDARFWLESSPLERPTRLVIIASINKAAGTIIMERWEMAPQALQARPDNNPNARQVVPNCVQILTLEREKLYDGPPLSIPATLVYDELPIVHGPEWNPSDFEITAHSLNMMNEIFWSLKSSVQN
ncbi:hypothetical protein M758_4G173700 [Ceratodon purpureus]|nr:hypothetical protein M758_4G173700 [Ceratodon purpureus]